MNSMKSRDTVIVSKRSADVIRLGGLVLPVTYALNAVLIHIGVISSPSYAGLGWASLLMVCWLLVGVYQFIVPSKRRLPNLVHILIYHVFGSLYLLFVTGINTPLIGTWAILTLASYIYFKRNGIIANIVALLAVFLISLLLPLPYSEIVLAGLAVFAAITIGIVTVAVWHANEIDNNELTRSREESILQRDRILTIVNNIADAILTTDDKGKVQLYNAASLNLLDTNIDIRGKRIDDILALRDEAGKKVAFSNEFKEAKAVTSRDDLSAIISDEVIRLSIIFSPIRSANSVRDKDGYIIILRDITKQKSLEEERDEFISVVSHELRTPLTIAEGSLSNVRLMMGRTDVPQDTLHRNVRMAHEQMVFLSRMVNDLSTLSRAERGIADDTEAIDVRTLIHDLYNEYLSEATDKKLQLDLDVAPDISTIIASRLYLKELIQNFITNAIKYTKKGNILISVECVEEGVRFSVKDSGIGISKSDQARIFDKFYRSEDYRTRETGGTGLGLYVASKLARKLHTRIELKSRLNHGSTFSFTIPRTPIEP